MLKTTLDSVPTLWILAIRFTGAAILMGLPSIKQLAKIDKRCLASGVFMGLALYAAYTLQTFGLVLYHAGKERVPDRHLLCADPFPVVGLHA